MENNTLTREQQYLMYVLPKLDDEQVHQIISLVNGKPVVTERLSAPAGNSAYQELLAMTGCEEAKAQLTAMLASHRMNKLLTQRHREARRPYYHAVFTGNPGCAKTTCARLYAKVLAQEGITKQDTFAELTRSAICGKYQGSTAPNVRDIFEKYAGGVIFIDEAYAINDIDRTGQHSYGEEAINEIILGLENDPSTVVIFAGYPREMEEFLASNPGLKSRIPYHVAFQDYTTEELTEIAGKIAAASGFAISASANDKLRAIFDAQRTVKDFGNGRFCRNLVEAAIQKKSLDLGVMEDARLKDLCDPALFSDEALFTLDAACFDRKPAPLSAPRQTIGFLR